MSSITKSQQLTKVMREAIRSGKWEIGDKLPGEIELQELYGFSRATIREALNSLVADGLIVRKHGVGSFVAEKAAASTVVIAADTVRLTSPVGYWYRSLVENQQRILRGAGFRDAIAVGHGENDKDFVSSTNLFRGDATVDEQLAGVINISSSAFLTQRLEQLGIPVVSIECGATLGTYGVILDYARFASSAVRLLNWAGYDDFAIMYFRDKKAEMKPSTDPVELELRRIAHACVKNNEDRIVTVPGSADDGFAYETFLEWWASDKRKRAIFFYDDSIFDAASRAILELGIRIPEDLAIITHANVGRRFPFPVGVTRIGFDASHVTAAAWGLMERLIAGEPVFDPTVKISPVIQFGQSLGVEHRFEEELPLAGVSYFFE